jgi:hypothetical protein
MLKRNCRSLLDLIYSMPSAQSRRPPLAPEELHNHITEIRETLEEGCARRESARWECELRKIRDAFPTVPFLGRDIAAELRESFDSVIAAKDREIAALAMTCTETTRRLRTRMVESAVIMPSPGVAELKELRRGWEERRTELDATMQVLSNRWPLDQ